MLLCQGHDPKSISHILKVSIDVIYEDQKQIKEKALEYFKTENNNAYGYYYNMMFETLDQLDKELHDLKQDTETIQDKLNVIKSIRENITSRKELLKDVINIFDLSNLKQDVKALKSLINQDPNKQTSYMNIPLPQIKGNNHNNDNMDNTYIVDTNISNDSDVHKDKINETSNNNKTNGQTTNNNTHHKTKTKDN